MAFLIADTLPDSVRRLTPNENRRVWEFIGMFQTNPKQPGISLERLQGNSQLWSGRISKDLRAILHKEGDVWSLLWADHHDDAYRWAENHQVERHPVTGVYQLARIAPAPPPSAPVATTVPGLFDSFSDEYLLSLSVPANWLPTLRHLKDEDGLLHILDGLPAEIGERLLAVAAGEIVAPPPALPVSQGFTHSPEHRQRFYVVEDSAELQRILDAPLHKWLGFLHPSQHRLAYGSYAGPLKVTGSAGTGKTVVAMHRARHLARQGRNVLLTTYVGTLADNLRRNLQLLCGEEELRRIAVNTVHGQAAELLKGVVRALPGEEVKKRLERVVAQVATPWTLDFLWAEWERVVSPQSLRSWVEYRSAPRTGRGRGLSARERKSVWDIFDGLIATLRSEKTEDFAGTCRLAREALQSRERASPFDAVIVDELQDLQPQELRFVAALADGRPDGLTLVGDAGQRIYPGGFSLANLGIATRGRSHVLRINYRTTEQIRRFADRILGETTDDFEGGQESRKGTRSLLKGPAPHRRACADPAEQVAVTLERIQSCRREGLDYDEMAVFARKRSLLEPMEKALAAAGIPLCPLEKKERPGVRLGTMHRAKGLEFKTVFVLDCSAAYLPLQSVAERLTDPADREEFVENDRRLFYVSLTRARDEVYLSWVGKPTPFLPPEEQS